MACELQAQGLPYYSSLNILDLCPTSGPFHLLAPPLRMLFPLVSAWLISSLPLGLFSYATF